MPCTQEWVLTHSLFVPVVDLVDVPKDYLVLALHALGDATGIHGRHVALQKSEKWARGTSLLLLQAKEAPAVRSG